MVPALRCLRRSPRPALARNSGEEINVIWKGRFQESCISQKVYLDYFYDMGRFWGKIVIPQVYSEFSLVSLCKQASSERGMKSSLPLLNQATKMSWKSIFMCNNFLAVNVSSKLSPQFLTEALLTSWVCLNGSALCPGTAAAAGRYSHPVSQGSRATFCSSVASQGLCLLLQQHEFVVGRNCR